MWQTLLMAIGLVFILEGILPFVAPKQWRQAMQLLSHKSDNTLRTIGLCSLLVGTLLFCII